MTATLCAAEDPGRVKGWGGRVIAVRLVLLALGQAAMVSGSSVVEFGTRNLALHSCLSHRTVARVLRMLAAEDDPLIDLLTPGRLARVIATSCASQTGTRKASSGGAGELAGSRRRARVPDPRRVAALVYQVLDAERGPRRRGGPVGPAVPLGGFGRAAGPG